MKKYYLLIFSIFCSTLFFAQNPGNTLNFDGINDNVFSTLPTVFDDIQNNDITLEAHIRYQGTGFTRVFFAQKDANNFFTISATNVSGQMELYFYVGAAGITHSVRTTTPLNLNQNYHIAARWTAATSLVELFVDGELTGLVFGGDTSIGTNNVMAIGARTDGLQSFNGDIDELALWNEARILCLIVQDANEGVTLGQPNLISYYTFNQGIANDDNSGITTLVDATGNHPGTLQNFALNGTTSNWIPSQAFSTIIEGPDTMPIAICKPPFTIQLDGNGQASITLSDIDNGSNDPCGVASIEIDKTDFTCADIGENFVTLTITNVNGNTATCTTIVTVEENIPPVAFCMPPFTLELDTNGQATITAAMIDNGSTDNCLDVFLSIDKTEFTCADIGDNTITLTVTDASGNSATCTTIVTVEDNLPPVAFCVAPFTIFLDTNGEATLTAADVDGGSTVTCGLVAISLDTTNFTCADIGENTVTLTVTDVNGNTSTCTTIVTVEDNIAPEALCAAPFTIQLDANGQAILTAAMINNGSTDACGMDAISISPSEFDCSNVGDNTVTLTVTDVNGNTSTCTTIVTVEDNIAPEALCAAPFTIQLDANGEAILSAASINNGSTDACGMDTISISPSEFDCSNVGDNTVTLTVTDVNGNTSTCTTIVTVEDNIAPEALCAAPFTIQLDANGQAILTAASINNGSSDACGMDTITISPSEFDCSNVGENTVTLTVTDVNGNVSTCTTIVTIESSSIPVITCTDFILELGMDGTALLTPEDIGSYLNACGTVITAIDIEDFDCSNIGTPVVVTYFATDGAGNNVSCTALVTVIDTLAPVIVCPNNQTVDSDPNSITYTLPDYFGEGLITATDNCTNPVTIFSQTPAPGTLLLDGTYTITFTATDEYSNQSTCSFALTVDSILGVENKPLLGSLTLYPNPASTSVMLSNPKGVPLHSISIYDILGRLAQNIPLHKSTENVAIDVSSLSSASYILIIETEQGRSVKQLLVK